MVFLVKNRKITEALNIHKNSFMKVYPEEGLNVVEVLKEPRNRFYVYIDKGLYVIVFLIFLLIFLYEYLSGFIINVFSTLIFVYVFVYIFYVRLGNLFRSENRAYTVIGKLYFNNEHIEVLNKRIDLFEIETIEITSFDFEGKSTFSYHLYDPAVSLGIDNFLSFRFKNGVVEKYQFKLTYDTQLYMFRKELVHYYKLGLIRELNIHEILGNHSFESKSDFRKHNRKYNA